MRVMKVITMRVGAPHINKTRGKANSSSSRKPAGSLEEKKIHLHVAKFVLILLQKFSLDQNLFLHIHQPYAPAGPLIITLTLILISF